jgi:hypothetical protein
LYFGCRELYVRSFQDPIGGSLCVGVGISVVSFNTQRYISGLRVYLASNTPDGGVTELSVGFVHASIETCIAVEEARPLLGFMVAVSPKGVKAMKPVVDWSSELELPWIGDINDGDTCLATLRPTSAAGMYTFAAGFDVSRRPRREI